MVDRNKDIRLGEEDNKNVVGLDKNSPVLQRVHDLMVRAVIKERLALHSDAQAQALKDSGEGNSASELWSEMPRSAREHEGALEDGNLEGNNQAEDSEFDEYDGVPFG